MEAGTLNLSVGSKTTVDGVEVSVLDEETFAAQKALRIALKGRSLHSQISVMTRNWSLMNPKHDPAIGINFSGNFVNVPSKGDPSSVEYTLRDQRPMESWRELVLVRHVGLSGCFAGIPTAPLH